MTTLNDVAYVGIINSIDDISCSETQSFGKTIFFHGSPFATLRLMTAHQIGTVLLNASGILLPLLVESTKITLLIKMHNPGFVPPIGDNNL